MKIRVSAALLGLIFLSAGTLQAQRPDPYAHGACPADVEAVIDGEALCFPSGGISINFEGEDSAKVACMQNKQVRQICGPDGRLTRQQAFTKWYRNLQAFQARCAADGGTFAFQDSSFKEPQNESFCLQAQPEIGSNMFEESLCNYRSICPAVTVVCSYGCGPAAELPADN